jgi:O-antigen/teichoic acid export membrane protein
MTASPAIFDVAPPAQSRGRFARLFATVGRYTLSASGPVATSGVHFLISFIFMREMFAHQFGMFSFVMVIVPFCMSMIAAALSLPITRSLDKAGIPDASIVATSLKMNILLSAFAMLVVSNALLFIGAPSNVALLMGLYGGVMSCRWFLRCFANNRGQVKRAVASDLIYAGGLLAAIAVMKLTGHVDLTTGAAMMLASGLAGLAPFGFKLLVRDHLSALRHGSLTAYRGTFRDLTRWSLAGVVLTEVTVNAHAYLVTFLAGPGAFALLALGQLLMRPTSLVQGTLPDIERPVMTRAIKAEDEAKLSRVTREFRFALLAVWLGTALLAAGLLLWAPDLLLKNRYAAKDVIEVTAITATIMLVRNFRAPLGTLLQAAGEFKALAKVSSLTSVISILATLALLLTLGPIASLGGILLGELVTWYCCHQLVAQWRARHAG